MNRNFDLFTYLLAKQNAGGGDAPTGTIDITENGEYDITNYATANVNVASGGITDGYTVKFKVNGNDYYIASCQQGESITEPPTPTMQGATFGAWQLNGVNIEFPYTPSTDVELTAQFSTVRTEMEIYDAGTLLWNRSGNLKYKNNNGTAICGMTSNARNFILVGLSADDVAFDYPTSTGNITYDSTTYYYCTYNSSETATDINSAFAIVAGGTWAQMATQTLEHYFYKD